MMVETVNIYGCASGVQDERPDLIWHEINDQQTLAEQLSRPATEIGLYFVSGKEENKYLCWKLIVIEKTRTVSEPWSARLR